MKKILTGIKPTGYAHIGNYFAAIKPAIEMSNQADICSYFFIADYHALTTLKNKEELQEYTYDLACSWLACGLNPEKVVFFKQSDIPEVFELNWILANVTPKGLMNRAHAYKAKIEKNLQENQDVDFGVNMGLYNYPILMASDILLFETDLVPVGQDQKQHVEIARDIANYFNKKYTNVFKLPDVDIQKDVAILYGLDGRKMSKSYNNTIRLFTSEDVLRKTINKIITDSKMPGEPRETDCTINKLYKLFVSQEQAIEFENKLVNGLGWGEAKKQLFEVMNNYFKPMRERYFYYMQNKQEVDEILKVGAEKAMLFAKNMISKVKNAIGVF